MGNRASKQVRGIKGLENREDREDRDDQGGHRRLRGEFWIDSPGPLALQGLYSGLRTKDDAKDSESARVVLALEGHWKGTRL